jgi:hypothetical protein
MTTLRASSRGKKCARLYRAVFSRIFEEMREVKRGSGVVASHGVDSADVGG